MTQVHFTAEDFARVRFAPRPAPLQELNAALMTMCGRDDALLYGRWRRRLLHSLPASVLPLRDLVPADLAPGFLDVVSDTLSEGLDAVRAARPESVRSELERVYAAHPSPAPAWVRGLHRGDGTAWLLLNRAQRAAFDTVVRPVWPVVQDLHHAEFTRHALAVAEHGIGSALTALLPGSRLHGSAWEFDGPYEPDIELGGRGLVLLPTFHWPGRPLVSRLPDQPVVLTYAAGPGLPLTSSGAEVTEDALAGVLGRTRCDILLLLTHEHTTSEVARRLGVSNATASAHTAALRGAGLISTVRAGRAVLHRRTALGSMLVPGGRWGP